MFYEIKLKVEKENSKGEMKEVVEHFITDVELFAEAEAKGLVLSLFFAVFSSSLASFSASSRDFRMEICVCRLANSRL